MSQNPSSQAAMERSVPPALPLEQIAGQMAHSLAAVAPERHGEFIAAYFVHGEPEVLRERQPAELARIIDAHLELGQRRSPGEDLVSVLPPAQAGWTLVQVVTGDRPFLVDTVSLVLRRGGWAIRNLYHPLYEVGRDAGGAVGKISLKGEGAPGDQRESWQCFEVYPPLGESAAELAPALAAEIREALGAVRLIVADEAAMREQLRAAAGELPAGPEAEYLRWLDVEHFMFLGYQEYLVAGSQFTAVPGTGLGILRAESAAERFHAVAPAGAVERLALTKDSARSPVGRAAHLDYVGVRILDAAGEQVGERRFLGLYTMAAHTAEVASIPLLAGKAAEVAALCDFEPDSHNAKALVHLINTYPRSEFVQASAAALHPILEAVANLREVQGVRLFIRPWRHGRFLSCTVYLPRERFSTDVQQGILSVLSEAFGAESFEYQSSVTESLLARLFVIIKLPDGAAVPTYDVATLEHQLAQVTRSWEDEFLDTADAEFAAEERGVEFSEAYKAHYTVGQAMEDLRLANELEDKDALRYSMFVPEDPEESADLRLKVLARHRMYLTRVMPFLDAMGVDIVDERPSQLNLRGEPVYVYDFGLRLKAGEAASEWSPADRERFAAAFDASLRGESHAGQLNELVMAAGLTWREVTWLRAIARYLQQAGVPYGQTYIAQCVVQEPEIAAALVRAFKVRFDPELPWDLEERGVWFEAGAAEVETLLEAVTSLDVDRILRMFLAVLRSMVRTNAFAEDAPALAFKLLPGELELLPRPRPAYEIFVSSPRVQGVHLRYGQVARGGLRWSDRPEDFRTEVLGLVKAQMVKNTVIVPSGAKGGFVPQQLPDPAVDRAAWLAEGVACYEIFVGSLLSVTDNIVAGQVVAPPRVVRHDPDDPYLVVAADKGTASFSDVANRISLDRGFWLGDAFASGGSRGYDHKGMGITARGAWESVKRHFYEMGIDCQTTDFTCVGIGDMAGDVFGNGMLRSRHTRLVAAFNHMHIFLDPNPDAATSYAERERLFKLPRSSWQDYDPALISAGGGVYERSAKSVPISAAVRAALGITGEVASLTPNELIRAIMKAPVDLLWNGGIGTYVKAAAETHAEVGDKANDPVRVNGGEVRAAVSGEGGNLGWTQKGRIEYALAGGRGNTDFIDNSGGVDTSDHEVNIKILLAPEVAGGRLAEEDRNTLLAEMTEEIAQQVLTNNYDQNLALAVALGRSVEMAGSNEAWMVALEASGLLDRGLESLPDAATVQARLADGRALTRPELATLMAYTKLRLESLIGASDLPDDPYVAARLQGYFPRPLQERFAAAMPSHRLHREILTMLMVNQFVNTLGITAYHRLAEETGANVAEVARAQLVVREICQVAGLEDAIAQAPELDAAASTNALILLSRMTERAARWLLNNRRGGIDIQHEIARMGDAVQQVIAALPGLLTTEHRATFDAAVAELVARGVPAALAERIAILPRIHLALPIVEIALDANSDPLHVARLYTRLAERLILDTVGSRIAALPRQTRWETMARAALRDDLLALHAQLVQSVLRTGAAGDPEGALEAWLGSLGGTESTLTLLREISDGAADLAGMSVALRAIRSLVR